MTHARFTDIFRAAGFCKSSNVSVPMEGDRSMFDAGVEEFNQSRRERFRSGRVLVLDESMSAWRPQTTPTGGLPNLSLIPRKPEPLGTEFKTVCDGETGILIYLETQKGKEKMRSAEHVDSYGVNGAIAIRGAAGASRRVPLSELSAGSARLSGSQSQSQFDSQFSQFSQISTARTFGGELVKVAGHTVYGDSFFSSAAVAEERRGGELRRVQLLAVVRGSRQDLQERLPAPVAGRYDG